MKLLQVVGQSGRCPVIMATYAPVLMVYLNATPVRLSYGLEPVTVEQTDHTKSLREFFDDPRRFVDAAIGE